MNFRKHLARDMNVFLQFAFYVIEELHRPVLHTKISIFLCLANIN